MDKRTHLQPRARRARKGFSWERRLETDSRCQPYLVYQLLYVSGSREYGVEAHAGAFIERRHLAQFLRQSRYQLRTEVRR